MRPRKKKPPELGGPFQRQAYEIRRGCFPYLRTGLEDSRLDKIAALLKCYRLPVTDGSGGESVHVSSHQTSGMEE